MIRAVLFDLDDTLISEAEYVDSGLRAVARFLAGAHGVEENWALDTMRRAFSTSARNVFDRAIRELSIDESPEVVAAMVDAYRTHSPEISFYPDVRPCLDGLRRQGIGTGIVTDGWAATQHRKLAALGAAALVDAIVVSDDLGKEFWKPHERPFEIARGILGVEFGEMAYVADNPAKDFAIAAQHPIRTVRIIRGHGVHASEAYLGGIREDRRISGLDGLAEALGLRSWGRSEDE